MNKFLMILLLFFMVAGCSVYHVESTDTTLDAYLPKSSPDDVAYLESVEGPYEVIGIVTVTTERNSSFDEVLRRVKREAAILGGDAITDMQTNASGTWQRIGTIKMLKNAYLRAQYSAKVVVLK